MIPLAEFAIIIAGFEIRYGLINDTMYSAILCAIVLTLIVEPYLLRLVSPKKK